MLALLRRMILLAGLSAVLAIAAMPRAWAQAAPAPARGNATPFPGGTTTPAGSAPKSAPAATSTGPATPSKIAVVNMQEALASTQEGKKELAAMKTKFDPQQAQLKSMSDDLDKMKADLVTAKDLSADERAKRQKAIDTKNTDLQARFEKAQKDFQQVEQEAVTRLGAKMMKVVDSYAKARGYDMVVDISNPQTPVVWTGDRNNITAALVQAYDQANPAK